MATTTTSATTSTGSNGAGILQSLGVGSGLDINSLVQQLTAAEMQPDNDRLKNQATQVGTQITALGQLKGALSSFQSALASLDTQADFDVHATSSADDTVFTATAAPDAANGSYQIEVRQLAQGQQLLSNAVVPDTNTAIGTGTLTITLGDSTPFSVVVDDAHSTLAGIRDAINAAPGNPGVSATIIYGTSGPQLVLTSAKSGAGETIGVAVDGDEGLQQLAYSPEATANYTEVQAAQDSVIKIAGVEHDAATNTVTDAVDGITLNLLQAKPGTPLALDVTTDDTSIANKVQTFVNAYNDLQTTVGQLGSYDAASQQAGPLLGQALLISVQSQLRRGLTDPVASVSGPYNSLAAIGITTNQDGSLSLDQSKLNGALKTDSSSISQLFGSSDGVATRLSTFVNAQLASDGGIALRDQTLADQQKEIADDQVAVNARTQTVMARYQAQFTAMDTLLAQLQTTSNYLTQQFAALTATEKANNSG